MGLRDDPKFFATIQRIVHLVGLNKFRLVNNVKDAKRDAKKHSVGEWEELIVLTKFIQNSITTPRTKGELYPNRAEYLELIGFDRILHENKAENQLWMTNFAGLKNHAAVHGFENWPKAGNKLHRFFWNQIRDFRLGRLKKSRHQWKYDLLNSINFPWPK